MTPRIPLCLALFSFHVGTTLAQPEFSPFFSDHMVIQRERPIHIDGRASPDTQLTAELRSLDASYAATAETDPDGAFVLEFPALPAGGPYALTVRDRDGASTISDIMIGDIWVCSGQSNMAWSLILADGGQEAIDHSHHPAIRLFTIPHAQSNVPLDILVGGPWHRSSPDSTPEFSAVGYFFGKELHERTGVPIGLVNSSWGGTQVEPWTHADAYQGTSTAEVLDEPLPTVVGLHPDDLERLNALLKTLPPAKTTKPYNALVRSSANPRLPGQIYNAMIHPITRYPITGAIWYQGESNASRAVEYRRLFPLMIEDWRMRWNQPDLPFLFVQLANFMERVHAPRDSNWAALREAQAMALRLPHTGMAVTIDIGEAEDIHPGNKSDVAKRLARHALYQTYQMTTGDVDGPVFDGFKATNGKLVLSFKSTSGGLELREPIAGAFAIASDNGPFHWADARLDDGNVVLSSPEVVNPAHVRYAWADNPTSPLYNASGLPASPFRTDRRPLPGEIPNPGRTTVINITKTRESLLENPKWTPAESAKIAVSSFQFGNPATGVADGDPVTRWSAEGLGEMLIADFGEVVACREVGMQFYRGDLRQTIFKIEVSVDGETWDEAFFGASAGGTTEEERFKVTTTPIRYVLITFYGNSLNFWNSINEIRFLP